MDSSKKSNVGFLASIITLTSLITAVVVSLFIGNSAGSNSPKDYFSKTSFPVTYSDKSLSRVGGYSEVIEHVTYLVHYLQNPTAYLSGGVAAPKGVIISGPSGVGKSFLTEAIAGQAGVPLIRVSASELQGITGESQELKLKKLFEQAGKIAPSVICLDEFELIASKRFTDVSTKTGSSYINSSIGQLLTLLSCEHPGVVVIATTNHYDVLDSAIVRPGRFDRHIALSLPNFNNRRHILEKHLNNKKLAKDVSLDNLCGIAAGFSGAKIAALVNEAAIAAAKDKSDSICSRHFDAARTILAEGIVTRNDQDQESKLLTAGHECGHALVGHLLGKKIYKISLLPNGNSWGRTMFIPLEESQNITKEDLSNTICVLLAGRAAEIIMQSPSLGCASDLEKAKGIANELLYQEAMGECILGSNAEVEKILQAELDRAVKILQENRATWEHLSISLIEQEEIFRSDFLKVIEGEPLPMKNQEHSLARKRAELLPLKAS